MSGESGNESFSKDRAELFEALGHPTRIRILQALAEAPLGFSNLKKAIGIESSGQLQFHLGKMNGLVKNTPEGNYALTGNGRDAMRVIAAQSHPENNPPAQAGRRRKRIIAALAVLLAFSIAINAGMAVYAQTLQFTVAMEDLRFERFRIVNLWLFETEEGTTYIGFNWEAYCRNPAASPLDFRFEDIFIGIELESANCSVGIGLIQSRNPSISNPFTEWVRVNPRSLARINGTCYFGPYGPEPEHVQDMVAIYDCLVEEGFDIHTIIITVTLSGGSPFVQIEKTLSLSHAQIVLLSY